MISPTFACEWARDFTHRSFVISPTELPRQANNGAGFKNRNARARSLTYKVFNAVHPPKRWITLYVRATAQAEIFHRAPALRGDHAPLGLVVPRRRGLPSPCPALLSPAGLRCSPPRPPGGLAAPRLWRLPPQPNPVYTPGGRGVLGLNLSENGLALTPGRACGLSRRAALRRRALVGQARRAQPMCGPSAHTFCLSCCFAALCPVVRFRMDGA